MSNKKLNIKSERLSRSLWLSDEFYVENVSEKVVGKIYKNATGISDYINTGGAPLFPSFMCAPTSNCYGISSLNGDEVNYIFYGSWTYVSISPESGKLFFMMPHDETYSYLYTEGNISFSPASHVGETIVIVANYHEGSSDDNRSLYGKPIVAAPFKIVNYEQFKEYLAKPEPGATKYYEIETMLSEMSSYESDGGTYDLADCCFYILDESYAELCSASISSSPEERIDGLVHLFNIYRTITGNAEFVNNSTLRFSVFPVNSYNGAYAKEAAYEINSSDAMITHSIVDDPAQPDGWYWDGLGWKAWGKDDLDPEEVQEIVNDMSLTSVTTGAFRLPTIDYGELLADHGDVTSSSSSGHRAQCSWVRIMKVPNYNSSLIYNIVLPTTYDYIGELSNYDYTSSIYITSSQRLLPNTAGITIRRNSRYIDQSAQLMIDSEGYLKVALNLRLKSSGYTDDYYTAQEIARETIIPTWLNSLWIVPSIPTDSYKCNLKNYMSSTTMALIDTATGENVYGSSVEKLKEICLFSTREFSSSDCGYGDYRYSFSFTFTPKVSGTYTVLFEIVAKTDGVDTVVKCNAGIASNPSSVADYNGREFTLTSVNTPFFAGFQITCDAYVPQYIHINSTGGYFSLMYLEIYGMPQLQTSDEGAQPPDNSRYITNVLYSLRSYTPTISLSNTMSSDSLFGWSMPPVIWKVDTTA